MSFDEEIIKRVYDYKNVIDSDFESCNNRIKWYNSVLWVWNDFCTKYYYKLGEKTEDFYFSAYKNLEGKIRDLTLINYIEWNFNTNKWPSSKDSLYPIMIEAFRKTCSEKYLINVLDKLQAKHLLINDLSDDVSLVNSNGEIESLETLKKKYRNKVIYIDFWASWCGPCREEMPTSLDLRNKYNKNDIVFIYVSIDDDKDSWQKIANVFKLPEIESYLAIKGSESIIAKQLNIVSIPRYVLINKSGDIEYPNAPKPSSQNINEIIFNMINEH